MANNTFYENVVYNWSEDSIRQIWSASSFARNTLFYVQEAGYFKTTDNYYTERSGLDSFLIIYTLSGEGKLSYRNSNYSVKAGQCFIINCNEKHRYETPKGKEWEFLWVHFNGRQILGIYEEIDKNGFSISNVSGEEKFEKNMKQILELFIKNDFRTEILASLLIDELITELLIKKGQMSSHGIRIPSYVKETRRYIEIHFRENLKLDDLARQIGLSKHHMSHEFKNYIGVPVNEYIIRCRISHAKELLRYSDKTINEIADSCGFSNPSYFVRLFKLKEGITPRQYRVKW